MSFITICQCVPEIAEKMPHKVLIWPYVVCSDLDLLTSKSTQINLVKCRFGEISQAVCKISCWQRVCIWPHRVKHTESQNARLIDWVRFNVHTNTLYPVGHIGDEALILQYAATRAQTRESHSLHRRRWSELSHVTSFTFKYNFKSNRSNSTQEL